MDRTRAEDDIAASAVGPPIIRAADVVKTYDTGRVKVHALRGVSLTIGRGEMVAIMGPSGCGKTTLLNCLSGLDVIDRGRVLVDGTDLSTMSDNEKTEYRARRMGFVFQFYNLLPVLSAVENVELPLLVSGGPAGQLSARPPGLSRLPGGGPALRIGASHSGACLTGRGGRPPAPSLDIFPTDASIRDNPTQPIHPSPALPVGGSAGWRGDHVMTKRKTGRDREGRFPIAGDRSERRQAEEALRESEERFRSAFEHAATGMALVRPDGRLLQVNRACCEAIGYSEQELTSTTWQAITHPDDVDITRHHVRRVLAGESDSFQLEKRFVHKLGHVLWGHVTSSLLRDADGRPLYFITQIQDMTERKRAEEALRESEERYRDLVENINDVIYAVDESGWITYISPVIEQLSGYSPAEVTGRSFAEFVYPDDLAPLMERFRQNLSGNPGPNEYRLLAKSGEIHWVRTFSRPIWEGDRVVGLRGVLTDITERKRAEEALQAARKELESRVERRMRGEDPYGLTFRELTILHLVAAGRSDKEIGAVLAISTLTAHKHVASILAKMGVGSRTEASVRAVREGLLD